MSENNSNVVSFDVKSCAEIAGIKVRLIESKDSKDSYPEIRQYSDMNCQECYTRRETVETAVELLRK